ncbi:STM4504/CBY_0614 family protein [Emticicia sp. 17c]|uniref:STM4504/CBY_0614 family protein n=1 Tax=Emticicia sp. 17c TaxID=3127704 RepID=UPI00301BB9DB
MPILDLYSDEDETYDFYNYDDIPKPVRIQIKSVITRTIGEVFIGSKSAQIYDDFHKLLCVHFGKESLANNNDFYGNSSMKNIFYYFVEEASKVEALKIIDLFFKLFSNWANNLQIYFPYTQEAKRIELRPKDAIFELNHWLKKGGIGYQFESGRIIRLDSTFVHSEIVKPTLKLLGNNKFHGANDEYLKAHEHYLEGKNKECLNECIKAFESTLKVILNEKGWSYDVNRDTSRALIQICITNGLIPSSLQDYYTNFTSLLSGGASTLRNRLAAHGQGEKIVTVDDSVARYGLNLTGSNIIFLVEQSGII